MLPVLPNANPAFCEEEWMKLLYLLGDAQEWLDELARRLFHQLPVADKRRLFRHNYYLTPAALVHILERHYYKIPRHPGTSKFTIPLAQILHWLREGSSSTPEPLPGSQNHRRVIATTAPIGFDRNGLPASQITIVTDAGGHIITAFPGILE